MGLIVRFQEFPERRKWLEQCVFVSALVSSFTLCSHHLEVSYQVRLGGWRLKSVSPVFYILYSHGVGAHISWLGDPPYTRIGNKF